MVVEEDGRHTAASRWAKLIVVADPHMVPEGGEIIGIDPFDRLKKAVGHINKHQADASRVVVLGDLAHGGDTRSYRRLRRVLDRCTAPYSLTLGNHDHRPSLLAAFPATPVDQNGYVQCVVDVGSWRVLLLDTLLEGALDAPSGACGHLCPQRLAWLDRRLCEAGQRPVVIAMHHPPMPVGFRGMDAVRLLEPARFLDVVRRYGNVRHIIAGHVHRTVSGAWHGIPFSIFKSTVHQQPMDLESDANDLSVAEPAAYGILLLTGDGVIVHTEDYEIAARAALDSDWATGDAP